MTTPCVSETPQSPSHARALRSARASRFLVELELVDLALLLSDPLELHDIGVRLERGEGGAHGGGRRVDASASGTSRAARATGR